MNDDWTSQLLWNLAGYGIVTGLALLTCLCLFLAFPSFRTRLLPLPRLRPGTWAGNDVFLAFCVVVGFPRLITIGLVLMGSFAPLIGLAPEGGAPLGVYLIRCDLIASPLTLTMTLAILFGSQYLRRGIRPQHYGWTPARWPANLVLGLAAFICATPVVLGVHLAAIVALPVRASPVIEIFKNAVFPWEWIFLAISVVVAAPLLEEILFRGILQGWLRRASLAGHLGLMTMTIAVAAVAENSNETTSLAPLLFALLLVIGYGFLMFRLGQRFTLSEEEIRVWQSESDIDAWKNANAKLSIYGSAMLFALFHANAWPAPIPLFVMGLVLGALAQRTQSLVGPITFHAFFNLATFIALYGSVSFASRAP